MKQESEETDYFCKHNNFQARHKQDMDSDLFIYPDAWRHNLIGALYSDSKNSEFLNILSNKAAGKAFLNCNCLIHIINKTVIFNCVQ